jgi:hypothetical protein
MSRQAILAIALVLTGCASMPQAQRVVSPCEIEQASYECQIERYNNVDVP